MSEDKNPVGRPKIEFSKENWDLIKNLCGIQCTASEIAGCLDVSVDTLDRRIKEKFNTNFADFFKRRSSKGKMSLRRLQFKTAEAGNCSMQIWLGKQYLGQSDNQIIEDTDRKYEIPESLKTTNEQNKTSKTD